MAIEVINKVPAQSVLKTVVCKNCGWEHRYAPIDVNHSVSHDYDGFSETWWYIRCQNPTCTPRDSNFTGTDLQPEGRPQTNYIEVKRP